MQVSPRSLQQRPLVPAYQAPHVEPSQQGAPTLQSSPSFLQGTQNPASTAGDGVVASAPHVSPQGQSALFLSAAHGARHVPVTHFFPAPQAKHLGAEKSESQD